MSPHPTPVGEGPQPALILSLVGGGGHGPEWYRILGMRASVRESVSEQTRGGRALRVRALPSRSHPRPCCLRQIVTRCTCVRAITCGTAPWGRPDQVQTSQSLHRWGPATTEPISALGHAPNLGGFFPTALPSAIFLPSPPHPLSSMPEHPPRPTSWLKPMPPSCQIPSDLEAPFVLQAPDYCLWLV